MSDFDIYTEDFESLIPPRKLKKAQNIEEIADAFDGMPLVTPEEMRDFYIETMDARTGNPNKSPIFNLEKACRIPRERGAMLLLGHRGCGKSTELNKMKLRLETEGRQVVMIQCDERLPLENNPRFSDLLILMGEALYQTALKVGVSIAPDTLKLIQNFWTPVVFETERVKEETVSVGAGVEIGAPPLLQAVTNLFAKLNSDLKYNDTVREKSETRIKHNYAQWRNVLWRLSDAITKKVGGGKQPVLIFEGLDHLEDLEEARNLFFSHADKLTNVSFPVIYTFPIALYYDKGFAAFEHSFQRFEVFPMLKLETLDGQPYPEGVQRLRDIVSRRVAEGLIHPDALELMISKTGGSLRDLFKAIRDAAELASYRGYRTGDPNQTITPEDAEQALKEVQGDLTRRIEGDEHKFLAEICAGKRREIERSKTLLDMLQARAVLEYNGERWFNVHPLVADYLEELHYVRRKEGGAAWEKGARMRET